jgi:cell division septal protein FtsQ
VTLPVRAAKRSRRQTPTVRRASAGISAARIAAVFVALVTVAVFYGVVASPAFSLQRLELAGARFTDRAVVERAAGLAGSPAPNAFTLDTEAVRAELRTLPAVIDVDVEVALPDLLRVRLVEREPVLAWQVDGNSFLVSADGVVLSETTEPVADLPVFADERTGRPAPAPGRTLDETDIAAARRLGSLTPEQAGSTAGRLVFQVTDAEGFVVTAPRKPWRAIFGIYTPTLRPPDIIPSQVQCLAGLLAAQGEAKLEAVYLFPEGDRCGTFVLGRGAAS